MFGTTPLAAGSSSTAQAPAILDKNWQTTAAVAVAVGTGGVTGALMLTAFPAQTLAAAGTVAGLGIAGHRRSNGEDPCFGLTARFSKKSETKSEDTETEVTADAAPEAA